MLAVNQVSVFYDQIRAVRDVSFKVSKGEIFTVLGANGAGKTTLLRTIMGLKAPEKGNISFLQEDITSWPAFRRSRAGIILVPEGRGLFPEFTVRENLLIGAIMRTERAAIDDDLKFVYELFPRLKERILQKASSLSGGEQQMLVIGRALMSKPRLLLMDEPSMGIMPALVEQIFLVIKELKQHGITVLLVEQNAQKAFEVADNALVIEMGEVVLTGTCESLKADQRVQEAYLGK